MTGVIIHHMVHHMFFDCSSYGRSKAFSLSLSLSLTHTHTHVYSLVLYKQKQQKNSVYLTKTKKVEQRIV